MKPGDIVRLKCGGPKMVVNRHVGTDSLNAVWNCRWHRSDGEVATCAFFAYELEPVSEGVAAGGSLSLASAIAKERDEWKAKAGKYESEAHDWRSKADELQGALDVVSKLAESIANSATAMKAWRLLADYVNNNAHVTCSAICDFIRDNPPPSVDR